MNEIKVQDNATAAKTKVLNLEPNIGTNQRIFSVVSGSVLLIDALARNKSIVQGLAAGYLLFRGATGYCAVTEGVETAAPKIKEALGNARERASEAIDGAKERIDGAKDKVQDGYQKLTTGTKEAIDDYTSQAKDAMDEYKDKAKDVVSDYKHRAEDAIDGAKDKAKIVANNLAEKADKVLHLNSAGEKYDINIETRVRVHSHRQEVYNYWRNLENLPKFMEHLQSVTELDKTTSQWKAKIPGGIGTIDWKAEIVDDKRLTRISWKSVEGADVENAGTVDFIDAGKQGTDVHVVISYHAPAGKMGSAAAKLLNPAFEAMIDADIKRFAEVMEQEQPTLEHANGQQAQ